MYIARAAAAAIPRNFPSMNVSLPTGFESTVVIVPDSISLVIAAEDAKIDTNNPARKIVERPSSRSIFTSSSSVYIVKAGLMNIRNIAAETIIAYTGLRRVSVKALAAILRSFTGIAIFLKKVYNSSNVTVILAGYIIKKHIFRQAGFIIVHILNRDVHLAERLSI